MVRGVRAGGEEAGNSQEHLHPGPGSKVNRCIWAHSRGQRAGLSLPGVEMGGVGGVALTMGWRVAQVLLTHSCVMMRRKHR